ncbi:hypothetical protein VTN00DRAFT_2737 [Thermoascus crustaceus]|uniref:uncharacterized protein n=1 Tax=Thermoascus crustaceus TaxID=5088 RepID=UPI0037434EAF
MSEQAFKKQITEEGNGTYLRAGDTAIQWYECHSYDRTKDCGKGVFKFRSSEQYPYGYECLIGGNFVKSGE